MLCRTLIGWRKPFHFKNKEIRSITVKESKRLEKEVEQSNDNYLMLSPLYNSFSKKKKKKKRVHSIIERENEEVTASSNSLVCFLGFTKSIISLLSLR